MADELFRVTFFVKDKDLARIKRLLIGVAIDVRDEPVINAVAKGNGTITAETEGTSLALFERHLAKAKVDKVQIGDASQFLHSIGRSPGSGSYLIKEGLKHGVLKATEARGIYKVIHK